MNIYVFTLILFTLLVVVIELLLYAWRGSRDLSRAKVTTRRLQEYSWNNCWSDVHGEILKTRVLSSIPLLNSMLAKMNLVGRLETLVRQANAPYPPAVYLMLTALLGVIGFLAGGMALKNQSLGLLSAFVCCLLPCVWLQTKKATRMKKFAIQLPEALDLIARSLKAGHAFTSGLKLAADSFPDPLGTEFGDTINEINFGLSVPDALKNLGTRVESADLHYFIVSTILQRDTGGNLAEITASIAHLIRERFKFNDKVRVLAAEGKISAIILIALPFVMFFAILKLNPSYIEVLLQESVGKMAVTAAMALMLCGIGIILKMIKINV